RPWCCHLCCRPIRAVLVGTSYQHVALCAWHRGGVCGLDGIRCLPPDVPGAAGAHHALGVGGLCALSALVPGGLCATAECGCVARCVLDRRTPGVDRTDLSDAVHRANRRARDAPRLGTCAASRMAPCP